MPTDEQITLVVDTAEVDEAIAKMAGALNQEPRVKRVKDDSEDAMYQTKELEPEHEKIKGTNLLVRRTIAQLPGIREGYRIMMLMRTLLRVSPEIALILVAWMAGTAFMDWLGGQAKEAEGYRKMVMEARGFTTRAQFDAWQAEDNARTASQYRSVVVQ